MGFLLIYFLIVYLFYFTELVVKSRATNTKFYLNLGKNGIKLLCKKY